MDKAAELYQKLKSYLWVVEGWGYYPPNYGRSKHIRVGYSTGDYYGIRLCQVGNTSQNWVVWGTSGKRNITFKEWLMIYNIEIQDF